jgi:LacI family transcriptional regulator
MEPLRIVFVGAMQWAYNRLLLHGAAVHARTHQWALLVQDPATPAQVAALDRHVDGLMIAPHPLLSNRTQPFARPAVSLSADHGQDTFPRVINDDLAAGRLAAEHLTGRGFRYLAFVGDHSGRWWMQRRYEGFCEKLAELGLTCVGHGIEAPDTRSSDRRDVGAEEQALLRWVGQLPRPLGVLGCNDEHAARTIRICRRLGLRIPEDVAVVGVDNDDLYAEVSDPPLSTVSLQNTRMGYEAGALLARLIDGETPPTDPLYIPPGELIVRQSSDTVATNDPVVMAAIQFIRQRLSTGANVKELLAEVQVSRSSLDARFQAALGRTAAEEIRRARIERAKQLLSTSELSMPQVARHAGFSCARQLSETFHHETGVPPTAYRQRFRMRGT